MSKKRVFANNNDLNFNEYLKYKKGKEIIQNIKTKTNLNKNINVFLNYDQFITLTKTYFKYFINEGPVINIPVDIYNSNTSFIVYDNLLSHIKDCNKCRFNKDIIKLYDCDAIKGILYPYGKYIEYKTSSNIFLHNRINLDDTCKRVYCKELNHELSLDKKMNVVEMFPSQNSFIIQPIQYDNYSQQKRMDAYAVYPHLCIEKLSNKNSLYNERNTSSRYGNNNNSSQYNEYDNNNNNNNNNSNQYNQHGNNNNSNRYNQDGNNNNNNSNRYNQDGNNNNNSNQYNQDGNNNNNNSNQYNQHGNNNNNNSNQYNQHGEKKRINLPGVNSQIGIKKTSIKNSLSDNIQTQTHDCPNCPNSNKFSCSDKNTLCKKVTPLFIT